MQATRPARAAERAPRAQPGHRHVADAAAPALGPRALERGPAQRAGDEDAIARAGGIAPQLAAARHRPDHRDRERELARAAQIAADERAGVARRLVEQAGDERVRRAHRKAGRRREREHAAERPRAHRRQVREVRHERAAPERARALVPQAEVHALEAGVGADGDLLAGAEPQDRGVVPDPEHDRSPAPPRRAAARAMRSIRPNSPSSRRRMRAF